LNGYDAVDEQITDLRRRRVLAKMQLLSESPGASIVVTHGLRTKKTSKPPSGVRLNDEQREGAPDKNRSLFDHYRWRFAHAPSYDAQLLLCALAERDYLEAARGNRRPTAEDKLERDRRILREYEGVRALEAAVLERVSESHVQKLRRGELRDAKYGLAPESAA
jgi:hypothetical protein